ncbi:DUF5131 family protein [Chromobacterium haemolyticum]|uniref:DUF5131 family protein n=1 Tax=Chromobacterium haemolyticum TaxID=394935 RepID=UPI001745C938|nr:phage Gp37/Gp68 family protein [Chromobacterium haemolyticum]QOD81859.1 phage Gp37/Gp68 family protein [Chromobacterium haemolyticum]
MSDKTGVEWTDATWNPVTGCAKVSQGCKNCYALRDWARLSAMPNTIYHGRQFTDVMCHPERLGQPFRWARPRRIFVNSMSDLFHPDVPFEFIAAVFWVMGVTCRHTYQVLTKRPARMVEFFQWVTEGAIAFDDDRISDHMPNNIEWKPSSNGRGGYDTCGPRYPYPNIWLGVSIEDQATADERIPLLLQTPAAVRWISAEPLLGPVDLETIRSNGDLGEGQPWLHPLLGVVSDGHGDVCNVGGIDWVVVGGESGHKARPMHPAWALALRDQCVAAGVPFLFKQWGEWVPSKELHRAGAVVGHQLHSFPWGQCNPQMARAGKKAAGRLLDGAQHDGYPKGGAA